MTHSGLRIMFSFLERRKIYIVANSRDFWCKTIILAEENDILIL